MNRVSGDWQRYVAGQRGLLPRLSSQLDRDGLAELVGQAALDRRDVALADPFHDEFTGYANGNHSVAQADRRERAKEPFEPGGRNLRTQSSQNLLPGPRQSLGIVALSNGK